MIIHLISIFKHLLLIQVAAITLWPFIVFKHKEDKTNEVLINHETIHLKQQLELLVIPFYIIYITEHLILLVKHQNHNKAYRNISFDKEAYYNDTDPDYLKYRKFWAMWRYTDYSK
ncbi:hypothetical protein OAD66_09140 [Bacteroidia bacterium]|nr:hypothetical protein [Bacteroidia bacterium]MDB9883280.1 hypothetical protein [Bacteroidia bacterium]